MERKRDCASILPTVPFFFINLITYCGFAMLCPGNFPSPRGRFTEPGEETKFGLHMTLPHEI
jgi:hypothetical protein